MIQIQLFCFEKFTFNGFPNMHFFILSNNFIGSMYYLFSCLQLFRQEDPDNVP